MEHIEHRFQPGETIRAVIRKHNRQKMPQRIVDELQEAYNELNPQGIVHVGDTVKIPVYDFSNEPPEKEFVPTIKPIAIGAPPRPAPIPAPTPTYTDAVTVEEITLSDKKVEFVPKSDDERAMAARMRRREAAKRKALGEDYVEPKKPTKKTKKVPKPEVKKEEAPLPPKWGGSTEVEPVDVPIIETKQPEEPKRRKKRKIKPVNPVKPVEKAKGVKDTRKSRTPDGEKTIVRDNGREEKREQERERVLKNRRYIALRNSTRRR